jgi:PAS domain S-box-containing protein
MDPDGYRRRALKIFQEGGTAEFDTRHRTKSGELRHVRLRSRIVLLGGAMRILSVWQDETEHKRAEETVQRSNALLRAISDTVPDLLFVKDHLGRLIFANPATMRAIGKPGDQVLGRTEIDWADNPEQAAAIMANDRCVMESGEMQIIEESFDTPMGTRLFLSTKSPLRDEQGQVVGLVGMSRDITDHKKAERALLLSEVRLRQTLQHAAAGVWEWDIATGRLFWSPENFALHGVDRTTDNVLDDAVWRDCLHPDDIAAAETAIQNAVEGRTAEYKAEFRVIHPQRGTRWILAVGKLERGADGIALRLRGLNLDITERKQAEEELRRADQRKNDFLAILSHELRNPLAPIRNGILLLERAPPGSEPARLAMEVLRRQTDHLARLVDDLLDVARIAYGKIELKIAPIDAREAVKRAWLDASALFEQRGVSLQLHEADEPIWVDADAARLEQMIGNLLNNALKFTPPGGCVQLAARQRDGGCELVVKDSGIGIERDQLQLIFDPFVQSAQTSGMHGGLGIGLALVRELAAQHGGSVRADSDGLDRGAEFVIQLPLGPAPAVGIASSMNRALSTSLAILIIEDNVDAAATLADLLKLGGHRVTVADTGRAGLEAIASSTPDALICDIGLPDMSGYDVIRSLRTSADPPQGLFAIALTGYAQPEDQEAALAAGFNAHLPKPPPFELLQKLLNESARKCRRDTSVVSQKFVA